MEHNNVSIGKQLSTFLGTEGHAVLEFLNKSRGFFVVLRRMSSCCVHQ